MLILPLALVLFPFFGFCLEELVCFLLCLFRLSLKLSIIQLFEIIFLLLSEGIYLTNEINIFSFETLIHVTVIDDLIDVICKVGITLVFTLGIRVFFIST